MERKVYAARNIVQIIALVYLREKKISLTSNTAQTICNKFTFEMSSFFILERLICYFMLEMYLFADQCSKQCKVHLLGFVFPFE